MKYHIAMGIIGMVLQASRSSTTKAAIMNSASLSRMETDEYVQFLQEKNLLSHEKGTDFYRVTQKGMRCLRLFDEINVLCTLNGNHIATFAKAITERAQNRTWNKDELIEKMRDIISP